MAIVPKFDDKVFIDKIESFPCLYHRLDKNFKKNDLKALCWEEIGSELHCEDTEFLKKKWMNLREKFTRLRKEETEPQWPLYATMEKYFGRFFCTRPNRTRRRALHKDGNEQHTIKKGNAEENIEKCDNMSLDSTSSSSGPSSDLTSSPSGPSSGSTNKNSLLSILSSQGKAPDVIQYCNSFGERLSKLSPEKAVEAMRRMESILTELE